ncbi:HNH endonuclease [Mycobacteroides stephanolepidis]|uniref:HNH endonuclease n=1 Tax=[Mycobacterium] stephanolepidis TaxID=1520670 RepID=A0A1Z4F190_9MYCO|nr:HNH endonuclease [[Mycobacterium] stephanolepidis]
MLPTVVRAAAVLAAVLLPLSLLNASQSAPTVSAAEKFGQAATAAFSDSTAGLDESLTSAERAAGLPVNPAAGLVSQSPAGAVEMTLPTQLGAGQLTRAGQMVYPDQGAGFDLLAENTRDGYRTVARINGPDGVRSVTTYVSTPADTVMLMHSSGHLTLNRATEQAETLGVMSPAEARDATGRIVYSAYVAKQVAPQLYQVSEVISPTESTTWPVYVDPPISVGGDYSQFGWSDVDHTLDAIGHGFVKAGEAIGKAFEPLADGQQLQAQAVGDQVRQHPLESAVIVGSSALMATGVGSAAGAGVLARVSLTLNIAATGTEAVAATDPNNKGLQNFSAGMQILAAVTPQGLAKKTVENVAENALEQGVKKADDIASEASTLTRVTPETATNPAQLARDVGEAGKAPEIPKAPNAPPGELALPGKDFTAKQKDDMTADALGIARGPRGAELDQAAAQQGRNMNCTNCKGRVYRQEGPTRRGDIVPPNRAQFDHDPIPRAQGGSFETGGNVKCQHCNIQKSDKTQAEWAAESQRVGEQSRQKIGDYEHLNGTHPDGVIRTPNVRPGQPSQVPQRPSSPADQRQVQAARAEQASQAQRSKALQGARMVNAVGQQQSQHNNEPQVVHARPESQAQQRDNQAVRNQSITSQTREHAHEGARPNAQNTSTGHNGSGSSHDSGSHSKNSGSKKNNKGNGKGNRAKRSRTGRH